MYSIVWEQFGDLVDELRNEMLIFFLVCALCAVWCGVVCTYFGSRFSSRCCTLYRTVFTYNIRIGFVCGYPKKGELRMVHTGKKTTLIIAY